jgi:hypothetical protein
LNAALGQHMSQIDDIAEIGIVGTVSEADFSCLKGIQGKCMVVIEGEKLLPESTIERIRRELPHLTVFWVQHAPPQ